jgi:hypothetical protein
LGSIENVDGEIVQLIQYLQLRKISETQLNFGDFPSKKPIATGWETSWNGRKVFVSANFKNESHSDFHVELQVTMEQPVA